MTAKIDRDRERRMKETGKWFESGSYKKDKNIYLSYLLPLLLIISICSTIFIALSS